MKGLILKDLLVIKSQFVSFLFFIAIYAVISFTSENEMLNACIALLAGILPISALAYDERANWDRYALTMPVTRAQIVVSKYLLGLLLIAAALALNTGLGLLHGRQDLFSSFSKALLWAGTSMIYIAVIFPMTFKFGSEKARIAMFLCIFIPIGLVMLLPEGSMASIQETHVEAFLNLLPLIALGVLFLSMWLSVCIYRKKEL